VRVDYTVLTNLVCFKAPKPWLYNVNPLAQKMYEKTEADENTRVGLGVGVILQDVKGRILLEKRSDCKMWGLPGGKPEPGEQVEETAAREVLEETGYVIEITRLLGVYSDPVNRIVTYLDNGDVVHLIDIVIEARIVGGSLRISEESEDLRFFDPEALPQDLVPPSLAPLQDFLASRSAVIR